jgi:flagellar motor protein MotB
MKQVRSKKMSKINIRKSIRLLYYVLIISGISGVLSAQQAGNSSNSFQNQWFVGVGGGSRIYFADHAKQLQLKDRISLGGDLFVGKWFVPAVGARIGGSYQSLRGAAQNWNVNGPAPHANTQGGHFLPAHGLYKQQFNAINVYGDILFNASNIFGGANADRFWSITPFAGLGYARTLSPPYPDDKPGSEMSFNVGLYNSFRISRSVDLNVDVRGAAVYDRFKVGKGKYPHVDKLNMGGRPFDGILSVNIGLTYRFGGKCKPLQMVYYPEPVYYYSDPIIETVIEKVTEWKDVASDVLILFLINQSTLLKDARVQIGFLAKLMQQYPESTYSITGYADEGTGNPDLNLRLSSARAERVKDCLVAEFGIAPSRLKTVAVGGIENRFYDDPALSRSVIIRPEKY